MLEQFMEWLGFGLCHQLAERSFSAGGVQLPVCARDTGIYIGFVVSLMLIGLLHRAERPTGFPAMRTWAVMAVMGSFMAWDGVTSYAGLRTTTNDLRLLSGLAMGMAMAVVVVPILNDELWRSATRVRVLDPARRLLVWLLGLPAAFFAVRLAGPLLGSWFAILTAVAIIATLAAVNLVIVAMLPLFDRRAESWTAVVPAVAVATAIAFVEIALAGDLRGALLQLVG